MIECQPSPGISYMDFGYTTKSEGYPTLMSDITESSEISVLFNNNSKGKGYTVFIEFIINPYWNQIIKDKIIESMKFNRWKK